MHRDLKPQNILLDGRGNIKLADFGLAKYTQANVDLQMTHCGTPVYMAPEIADFQEYGIESDLWSLGCILLEIIVGNKPWPSCTRVEEGRLKKKFFFEFSDGRKDIEREYGIKVSPLYLDLLRKLLKRDPKQRLKWS